MNPVADAFSLSSQDLNQASFISPTGKINAPKILENFSKLEQKKGQIVFHQGAYPFGVYYVHSGVCKVYREGGDCKEKIIRFARKGDFLGYAELMGEGPYGNSVEVLQTAEICFIPREDFMHLLQTDGQASLFFMRMLCEELSEVEAQLTETAYKPVKRRLAESLLSLSQEITQSSEPTSGISLSRADLAQLVGTAKETVIRFLSEFRKKNLISIDGRKIFVTDPGGLSRISEMA